MTSVYRGRPEVVGRSLPTTRLYEIWFEKKWGDKIALRAGQLAADTEFITAKYTDVFTNASLGWPAGLSLDLPSGGCVYQKPYLS
jgi:porin